MNTPIGNIRELSDGRLKKELEFARKHKAEWLPAVEKEAARRSANEGDYTAEDSNWRWW